MTPREADVDTGVTTVPPRRTVRAQALVDLAEIARDDVAVVCLARPSRLSVRSFLRGAVRRPHRARVAVDPSAPDRDELACLLPFEARGSEAAEWLADVSALTTAFGDLLEAREVGVRLAAVDVAMCPRFHVDRVEARAVCTYLGAGTEWLEGAPAERALAGAREDAGDDPRRASAWDLVLMKGELWPGPRSSAVHRSPAADGLRVVVTWDLLE